MLKSKRSMILNNITEALEKTPLQMKYLVDFMLIMVSYWLSYYIRFEGSVPANEGAVFIKTLPVFIVGFLVCDFSFGLARGMWRYVSVRDLEKILGFILAGNGLSIISGLIAIPDLTAKIPRSIYVLNSILLFLTISGARIFYRRLFEASRGAKRENALIIGDQDIAASLQASILKDSRHQFKIAGFITFDEKRLGNTINAAPVLGLLNDLPGIVKEKDIRYVFIAVDAASNSEMKNIIRMAQESGALVRVVPTLFDMAGGKFSLKDLREVKFEDYLEREPVEFNMRALKKEFYQKRIFVTGGGGSIGSSICREIIGFAPAELIILDISENNLFNISCQLKDICKKEKLSRVEISYKIGDVHNTSLLQSLFKSSKRIDYVIHAAAHKHVPLSELNPAQTIITNIEGTSNLVEAASQHKVGKFVYISTDKAVEPVSVMGATKRVGEFLIKAAAKDSSSKTRFMSVRFGNVIGSSGNVIEIFTEQLLKGKPLTITDPNMERYFMSLNEATRLILQAVSMGEGGETFVLDMGKPVKIKDLAYDIALFYGKHLKDDDIVYTGKREGERLSEALFNKDEATTRTHSKKIFKAEETVDIKGLQEKIGKLCRLSRDCKEKESVDGLFSLVSSRDH